MAAVRLEAVNTFLVNSFNDVLEQLTNGITNSTATFNKGVVPEALGFGSTRLVEKARLLELGKFLWTARLRERYDHTSAGRELAWET